MADAVAYVLPVMGASLRALRSPGHSWFSKGSTGMWIGLIEEAQTNKKALTFGDVALPVRDANGRTIAVAAAHLNWHRGLGGVKRLSDALDPQGTAQTILLDDTGVVVVGPDAWRNRPWNGRLMNESPPLALPTAKGRGALRFERLPDGQAVLVARAPVRSRRDRSPGSWRVQLSEPRELVYQRADALAIRIWWISICLGTATAVLGALGARHLTNRLKALTRSAAAVGRNEVARIEVPKRSRRGGAARRRFRESAR